MLKLLGRILEKLWHHLCLHFDLLLEALNTISGSTKKDKSRRVTQMHWHHCRQRL